MGIQAKNFINVWVPHAPPPLSLSLSNKETLTSFILGTDISCVYNLPSWWPSGRLAAVKGGELQGCGYNILDIVR